MHFAIHVAGEFFVPTGLETIPEVVDFFDPSGKRIFKTTAYFLEALLQPFKGDWSEILQRRMLRALVVYSRTLYFVDRGKQVSPRRRDRRTRCDTEAMLGSASPRKPRVVMAARSSARRILLVA